MNEVQFRVEYFDGKRTTIHFNKIDTLIDDRYTEYKVLLSRKADSRFLCVKNLKLCGVYSVYFQWAVGGKQKCMRTCWMLASNCRGTVAPLRSRSYTLPSSSSTAAVVACCCCFFFYFIGGSSVSLIVTSRPYPSRDSLPLQGFREPTDQQPSFFSFNLFSYILRSEHRSSRDMFEYHYMMNHYLDSHARFTPITGYAVNTLYNVYI